MNSFLKGTLVLVIASFLGECIEFLVNMVLARELGEQGLGMYMSILPTIFLVMLLASFELPISVSKFVAEKEEKYHRSMLGHAIRLTIVFSSVLFLAAIAILPFVPVFQHFSPLLRWLVILLIPIISFSSIARGFFMGKNEMGKIAYTSLLRKLVQLLLLVFLYQLFDFNTETAMLVAICTFIGSEIVIFLYLLHVFFIQYHQLKGRPSESLKGAAVRKNLMAVSIPTTALRVFHSITHAIQPFLIKAALVQAGLSQEMALGQFGMLTGIAMAIGFFPAFIAHSFLIMLIPAVSKAQARSETGVLIGLLKQVMLITAIYGIPAAAAIYFFAEPLTETFFHSSDAAVYLMLLCPYFLLHYFVIPMQAYLIGLGLMKDAFIHTVWSTLVSFSIMYFLGGRLGMDGIIIGMNTGIMLLTFMHYLTICKRIGITFWTLKADRPGIL
ncbi:MULTISPECIES: polysaccharide biosynthesis protein [Bacillus]|uniref:Polysaccharide biosynthesis protein n=1 Tax=Bacillus infantis TaxID=324767 RepID=A0A5D4SES4_9BACI|nr:MULTISPECIES: polysaccharide biosynthesis protein [Bacillus]RYI25735.1 polysaccharide biosynthesis protein [Bacillus infantis]TYS62097.1 polysaccharide biosynthesis protein [Bacillus infantis]